MARRGGAAGRVPATGGVGGFAWVYLAAPHCCAPPGLRRRRRPVPTRVRARPHPGRAGEGRAAGRGRPRPGRGPRGWQQHQGFHAGHGGRGRRTSGGMARPDPFSEKIAPSRSRCRSCAALRAPAVLHRTLRGASAHRATRCGCRRAAPCRGGEAPPHPVSRGAGSRGPSPPAGPDKPTAASRASRPAPRTGYSDLRICRGSARAASSRFHLRSGRPKQSPLLNTA